MNRNRTWRWFALLAALALVVAACNGAEPPTTTPATTTPTTAGPGPTDPGLEPADCEPITTPREVVPTAGSGEATWIMSAGWDSWNHHRPEGGSVYLIQALAGMDIGGGFFGTDGAWYWDPNALECEPVIISESPLVIEYRWHPDAVWYDSRNGNTHPVTVDDVIWSWYHNSGNEEHCVGCTPRATSRTEDIVSITPVTADGRIFQIAWPEDYSYAEWFAFLGVTYPAFVSDELAPDWRTNPAALGSASEQLNAIVPFWSAGPWYIEDAAIGEVVVNAPNPEWWGDGPELDTLVKLVMGAADAWIPALRNLEIDGGSPASFPVTVVEQMEAEPGIDWATGSGGAVWEHVDLNTVNGYFNDQALREAVFIALDRAEMRDRIFGTVVVPPFRTHHIFPQASANYVDLMSDTNFGTGDIEAARAILEEAGYTWNEAGHLVSFTTQVVPEMRFAYLQPNTNRALFVELAQAQLAEIGLRIVPAPIPPANLGSVLTSQQFDLVIFGWSGSPLFTNAPAQFWSSDSGSNFGRYSNEEVDELVQLVINQVDINESARYATEASRIVLQEAYVLPLWDTTNFMFLRDNLRNITDNHFSSLRSLYNSEEWGIAAN
jgi:peptide/nickel transport system substrate-binding protein